MVGINSADAVMPTSVPNLDLIPSHIDLVGAEIEMLNIDERENILKRVLAPLRAPYLLLMLPMCSCLV